MRNPIKITSLSSRIGLYIVVSAVFILAFFWLYLSTIDGQPKSLSKEETNSLLTVVISQSLPASAKLLYSQKYWEWSGELPATACTVFSLPQAEFESFREHLSNSDKENDYQSHVVPLDKGCSQFETQNSDWLPYSFSRYVQRGNRSRGYTAYLDSFHKVVMIEIYLFD